MMHVDIISLLKDNYCYVLSQGGEVALVDPGDGAAVLRGLETLNLSPSKIFITHHHSDHIAGINAIKATFECTVYGPRKEAAKIPQLDVLLDEGASVSVGGEDGLILSTPGHTAGHIVYWFEQSGLLFSGDTLFSLGCGRLLEGTAEDMFASLQKIKALPDHTRVYCGHDYTQANAEFCLSVYPGHDALIEKLAAVKKLRANQQPTIPSLLKEEKDLNLFLTCENAEAFAALRRQKDQF